MPQSERGYGVSETIRIRLDKNYGYKASTDDNHQS